MAAWFVSVPWSAYLIAGALSLALAVAEIVTVFEQDPVRALRTFGAFLLMFLNAAFAMLIIGVLLELGAKPSAWLGLSVGIGLPTLLKTRFTIIKPLPDSNSEGMDIQLDQLYARLQGFCRRWINMSLASKRVELVDQAIEYIPQAEMEQRLRLLLEGGLVTASADARQYVDKIKAAGYTEERVRILLAFGILNFGGHPMLDKLLKESKKAAKPK